MYMAVYAYDFPHCAPAGGVEACAWELRNCSMHTALVDVRTSTGRRDHAIISLPLISDDIVLYMEVFDTMRSLTGRLPGSLRPSGIDIRL